MQPESCESLHRLGGAGAGLTWTWVSFHSSCSEVQFRGGPGINDRLVWIVCFESYMFKALAFVGHPTLPFKVGSWQKCPKVITFQYYNNNNSNSHEYILRTYSEYFFKHSLCIKLTWPCAEAGEVLFFMRVLQMKK